MMHCGGLMLVAVSMLSLVAGMFLLMKACGEQLCCRAFHKVVAYAVIVISMLLVIFGGYSAACRDCRHGMKPARTMRGRMMRPEAMREMRKGMGQIGETEEAE